MAESQIPEPIQEPLDVATTSPIDVTADATAPVFVTGITPHAGLDTAGQTSKTARYTATQTSAILWDPGAASLVITYVLIQAGGTTGGELVLYFGTGAYVRGTNRAIFDGEFAPSATNKPGFTTPATFLGPAGEDLRVTTTAALNPLTITAWGYTI